MWATTTTRSRVSHTRDTVCRCVDARLPVCGGARARVCALSSVGLTAQQPPCPHHTLASLTRPLAAVVPLRVPQDGGLSLHVAGRGRHHGPGHGGAVHHPGAVGG